MDAPTFVAQLLPLRGEEVEHFIAEHAPEVDDLDAAAQLLKDEAKAQETRDLNVSLAIADQLAALANWTKAPGHRALALLEHANVLLLKGHHREAIAFLDTAGEAFLGAGDEIGWARTRISYLWSASKIGLTEQALEYARQALEIFMRYGQYERAGDLETNIALALMGVGRYQEALAAYDHALTINTSADTPEILARKARVLTNKALVLEMLGDLESALLDVQQARVIFAQLEQFHAVAGADHNQATLLASLGRYSAALHLYHRARDYYLQHHLSNWVAFTNANMADCLLRLNRVREAQQLAEDAVAIYRTLDETYDLGWALVYLARAQAMCGQMTKALDALSEAFRCFESVGAVAATGLVLLIQAELSLLAGNQIKQALTSVQEALHIFRKYQMESWVAEAHLLQGRAYELSDDVERAALFAEQSRSEARQGHLPWLEFGCEHLLGRLAERQGALEGAEEHYRAALRLLEGLMVWLVRDQRSTFLADKEGVFGALIVLSLHRNNPNSAFEYLERMKSQVLREYLTRSADIRLRASDPEEARLLEELQRLRQELHWYSSQIALAERTLQAPILGEQVQTVRGAQAEDSPEQQHHLLNQQKMEQRQRERAINDLLERAFLEHERSRFGVLAKSTEGERESSSYNQTSTALLAELLPEKSTLLEYFIQGDELFIFILHPKHRQVEVLSAPGSVSLLRRLLLLFRANIDLVSQQLSSKPGEMLLDQALENNIQGLSRRLYDVLLQPVERHIPQDGRLIIVPYGPLHTFPFHALQNHEGYLIERCEVSYLPAAAMLSFLSPQELSDHMPRHDVLVLGHSYHGRLPYALREAQKVATLLGGNSWLEDQATIERLNTAHHAYKIIHIAAHGENRADAPDFSHLQLADGQLSMIDVFNLDLPAELVTLSGCETGLVAIGGGDELLGLGRGFLYAGARSLLMSLWRVEDSSTAYLMEQFYQALLGGASKAGALRTAQRALLQSGREQAKSLSWQHPYFWAPFRLLGDASQLHMEAVR